MAAQPLVKKDEDYEECHSLFWRIEKGAVLQEARVFFNDAQLDSRRCYQVITKLLYLLNQGETFTKIETTEVFFAMTKLFRSTDKGLRRMVYLMIKELLPCADEVFIVTSSLMKDMNSKASDDMYRRANAIRVLCRIADGTLVTQIERYLKQAIVDNNPVVASAALVSGIHLFKTNPETVKWWTNEVQQAAQYSGASLVQFHALALLHRIRQHDALAISKMVTSLTSGNTVDRSPMAECLLIRYASQVLRDSAGTGSSRQLESDSCRSFYDYLESCLQHKAEMVMFEAARAITELPGVTNVLMAQAISALQLFLSSSKPPVLKFAAIRTLNKVAMTHPKAMICNSDMESMVSEQNRSIATFAITTLLKTTNDPATADCLVKKITNFMSEIADDELKLVVVEAIRSLCMKFPGNYRAVLEFLSKNLREKGGVFEYKKAILDSIVSLIRDIPEAKETGLLQLCEFIDENFKFTYLTTQILHLLGIEGPRTSDASRYIRYINNRVHLDANASVRASAVSTLAKFGAMVDSLKPQVLILLRRCLFDSDDEVRDRAILYVNTLGGDHDSILVENMKGFLFGSLNVPLVNLEKSLRTYLASASEEPFDITSVPKENETEKKAHIEKPTTSTTVSVSSIPEFSNFGNLFKSSEPVELTEVETEYAVSVVKHIFDRHIVFEYNCSNTIPEHLLEKVVVAVDPYEGEDFTQAGYKPIKSLPYGDTPGQAFSEFEKPKGVPAAVGKFSNMLRFRVTEVDPTAGEVVEDDNGVEDEYQLDDIEVVPADYMLKGEEVLDFRHAWKTMGPDFELVEEYRVDQRESLGEVVAAAINLLGMQPCEGTEVVAGNSRSHMVLLSGVYTGNVDVLVRLSFGVDSSSKEVVMKVAVRSKDGSVSCAIHDMVESG
ncbi:PREDICTED: coatomer subunit gamma-like [Fragaria vesca subsp. vesca]|uniref:coatomer subunit gamma-like n=1 Tax=Fragaria vesca subsp. vesca TaxID=101020 RepID=UPI0002C375C4|nr:PREDICTED: coatomer subunit gamma-like [Fragaria vesca subsp. vesca]